MAHINIYSKSLCVQCDGMLRTVNKAITNGSLDPAQVTVHMIDGTEPRADKVHEAVEIIRIESTEKQDALRNTFRDKGMVGAPAVVVKESKSEKSAEIDAFTGMNPGRIKAAIKIASDNAPVLAASA